MQVTDINPLALPSLAISERKKLPNIAACYLVLENENVIYVGQSTNLVLRWLNHHKFKKFNERAKDIRIAWLECADSSLLKQIEIALIHWFDPELNSVNRKKSQALITIKQSKRNLPRTRKGKFASVYNEPRGKPIAFRLPMSVDTSLREIAGDNIVSFIQQAVVEKLARERGSKSKTTNRY